MTYYPIAPLQQPDNMSCWITTLTLIRRWVSQDDTLTIEKVIKELGSPYDVYYNTQSGLPGEDTNSFCNKAGLLFDNPQNYSVIQWENNLKTRGPLLVDVLVFIDPIKKIAFTHSKLLIGIDIDLNDNLNSSFIFIDPAIGQEITETFQKFIERYQAIPANQLQHIQVCYSIHKPQTLAVKNLNVNVTQIDACTFHIEIPNTAFTRINCTTAIRVTSWMLNEVRSDLSCSDLSFDKTYCNSTCQMDTVDIDQNISGKTLLLTVTGQHKRVCTGTYPWDPSTGVILSNDNNQLQIGFNDFGNQHDFSRIIVTVNLSV